MEGKDFNKNAEIKKQNFEEMLFGNIGSKLKGVAVFACGLGFVLSFLFSIRVLSVGGLLLFLLSLGVGSLISWLSTLALYGLGQLIENTEIIKNNMNK